MKILDPQSAVLTNAELVSFMRIHPSRKADAKVGGYPVTDMKGLWSVKKEFTDFTNDITPHILLYPNPPVKYMQRLLHRLHKFKLTKPEVLMMVNLGVGVKKTPDPRQLTETHDAHESEMALDAEGDLLDRVERHINSSEKDQAAQVNTKDLQIARNDVQERDVTEDHPDVSLLNTIIEEMYERFTDADVNEILRICGEELTPQISQEDELP